jgi:predicted metal-dependent phosphoesterase TrpH
MVRGAGAKIDCHVHSMYSPDGRGTLKELVRVAKQKRLTGICVTDHNSTRMAKQIAEQRFDDFIVIPGMEVSTRQGHCLALGVTKPVARDLLLLDTLKAIEEAGGVGVPSHPYRLVHGVGEAGLYNALEGLHAIETFNARDNRRVNNQRAREFAAKNRLGGTGGSDAHQIFEVGNAYAAFKEPIETVDDFLDDVLKGRCEGYGERTPRVQLLGQNAKNALLFAKRGFRGI